MDTIGGAGGAEQREHAALVERIEGGRDHAIVIVNGERDLSDVDISKAF